MYAPALPSLTLCSCAPALTTCLWPRQPQPRPCRTGSGLLRCTGCVGRPPTSTPERQACPPIHADSPVHADSSWPPRAGMLENTSLSFFASLCSLPSSSSQPRTRRGPSAQLAFPQTSSERARRRLFILSGLIPAAPTHLRWDHAQPFVYCPLPALFVLPPLAHAMCRVIMREPVFSPRFCLFHDRQAYHDHPLQGLVVLLPFPSAPFSLAGTPADQLGLESQLRTHPPIIR